MKVSNHRKNISQDLKATDDFLSSPLRRRQQVHSNQTSSVNLVRTEVAYMPKIRSTSSIFSKSNISTSEQKVIRNKKLIIEGQLRLPKVDYLVTNCKAPVSSAIDASIKEKVKLSKQASGLGQQTVERILERQRDERRRKSLESFDSIYDDNDENLEAIIQSDPSKVMASRKDLTIHQKVIRLISQDKGLPIVDDGSDHEELEKSRKQAEIQNIKLQLKEIKQNDNKRRISIVDNFKKQIEREKFKTSKYYKFVKDPKTQLIQKKILANKDCSVFSNLYLLNNNPLFTMNNKICLPNTLEDAGLLANIFNVNMYKLQHMTEKYIDIGKQIL
jgi:hypothetical protein